MRKARQEIGRNDSLSATSVDLKSKESTRLLNPQAFSDLSHKIQALSNNINHEPKKTRKEPSKREKSTRAKSASKSTEESAIVQKNTRGKKRDSRGIVLEQGKQKNSGNAVQSSSAANGELEQEVYALGGTAEDLALVAGLDSVSELDDGVTRDNGPRNTKFENGLKKGASAILRQIEEHGRFSPIESDSENEGKLEKLDEEEKADDESSYTTPFSSVAEGPKSRLGKSRLLITPCSNWFDIELPAIKHSDISNAKISPDCVQQIYEQAQSLLERENEAFKANQQSSSSQTFYSTVIASGTLSDKISALTLAVQESPLHNVKALENLINLGKKRSRAQAVDVLRALKDLFAQGSLLPGNRKLHAFPMHPNLLEALAGAPKWKPGSNLPSPLQPQHLIVWAYESWLKEKYFEMLKTLEVWCNDEIDFSKAKAVNFVYELLKEKPEQESNLLRLLTNKLGDPSKKIASQTSYLLMQLMAAHPLMKMTIVSSIESDLLFRPGQSLHAKYYAVITLNQTALSGKEEEVASKLLDIYFSLFAGLLKPAEDDKRTSNERSRGRDAKRSHGKLYKSQIDDFENAQAEDLREKLTSAILTGINRAFPYTESSSQSLPVHLESLFKITHSSNFNTSIQAMMLIQQLCSSHQASADRFYRTLYESLLDARLIASSKHSLYLNLLYKALKADINVKRVKAFVKRILQVLALHQPSFICSCFFLLQELTQTFPSLSALIDQPEEHDVDEEVYEDVLDPEDGSPLPRKSAASPGKADAYDSRKRDPEHSHAENSCLWEVIPFQAHFHPSVSVSAEHLIRHAKLPGKPDLELHTLVHFLDRFVYRNPKVGSLNLRGSSIMQPLAGGDATGILVASGSHVQLSVNSEKFWARKGEEVAAEDAFFHQYFTNVGKTAESKKKARKTSHETGDDVIEDEESEIWKAMIESAPDLEGADNSDDDLEISDLESAFEESSDEDVEDEIVGERGEGKEVVNLLAADSSSDLEISSAGGSDHSIADENEPASQFLKEIREGGNARRRRLKNLPTFASASDYAQMIEEEEGEDVGSIA